MADYSLVPVEHQPDFENASLVPVDHDPFKVEGAAQLAPSQQAQSRPAQTQLGRGVQPQLGQTEPQSQSQPVSSAQAKSAVPGDATIRDSSGSTFVGSLIS
jgi:hypothetical protein